MASRGGWYLVLLWPAASFSAVAVAYLSGNAAVFGKQSDGSRQLVSTLLLLPYLLFAHAVWAAQVGLSREAAANRVNPALIISRRLREHEYPDDVGLICDLTCELSAPRLIRSRSTYRCHPILDAGTVSAGELIAFANSVPPSDQGPVLIHCANGHGRTGMFAAIWLMVHGYATSAGEAIALLKTARPGVRLRPRQFSVVTKAGKILCERENQP